MNVTNGTALDCPLYTHESDDWIDFFNFWVGGVTQTFVTIPGLLGNMFFSFILTRRELRNSFNSLLVALAFFDSCYLIGAQLEAMRVSFDMATSLHIILFPYLLYPGQNLAMTGSIFMIIAIAFERYVAVHNPLDYKQAMNDYGAIKRRLAHYLLPVIIASILFNVPKFFEATYYYQTRTDSSGHNVTEVHLNVTSLRIHPAYSTYVNWSQSLVLGFIPAALLVYFNMKIYLDVRERERRKRPPPIQQGRTPDGAENIIVESHEHEPSTQQQVSSSLKTPTISGAPKDMLEKPDRASKPLLKIPKPAKKLSFRGKSNSPSSPTKSNAKRRKAEDRMAMIFVAIVTGFLLTNFPRILLNFHEILVFDNAMACSSAGFRSFPVWSRILNSFSLLLMVINSSMNILFYGVFNGQFRKVARNFLMNDSTRDGRRREVPRDDDDETRVPLAGPNKRQLRALINVPANETQV